MTMKRRIRFVSETDRPYDAARLTGVVGWFVLAAACMGTAADGGTITEETVQAFVAHVQQGDGFDAAARAFVERMWSDRGEDDDLTTFIAESLAVLSPEFRAGLDAFDEEQYDKAHNIMTELSKSAEPYLAANASVLAIKSLVELDELLSARELLESFLADPTAADLYTTSAAELAFLRGYLALQDVEYEQSIIHLRDMLHLYPDADQRLRVSARQMLAELRRRRPEQIGDVADLMHFAGRRLGRLDTGERVQDRQQRAIDLLERLIEEAEQKEQSGSCSGGGGGSGSQGGRSPSSPMQDSTLPGGPGASDMNLRSSRQARPGEVWGSMPPAQRERILQQLRDSFPSRYRQLVEQYYEELGKQP